MASVTIHTVLNADALQLPELRGLLGKRVELRVSELRCPICFSTPVLSCRITTLS